jgi:hypothetical protein
MDIRQIFSRLKTMKVKASDAQSGMLVRSYSFKRHYRNWIAQNHPSELLKSIYTTFTLNKAGVQGDLPLLYFPLRNGDQILIHQLDHFGKDTLSFLSDYFRDRIVRLGYKLYLSDKQIISHQSHSARVERHILHPRKDLAIADEKLPQLYGNIELRVQFIDDKPIYLSILSEPIEQSNYSQAYPFDELAELLFI